MRKGSSAEILPNGGSLRIEEGGFDAKLTAVDWATFRRMFTRVRSKYLVVWMESSVRQQCDRL